MLFSPGMASFLMVGAPVATLLVLLAVVLPLVLPELRRMRHAHDAAAAPDALPIEPASPEPGIEGERPLTPDRD